MKTPAARPPFRIAGGSTRESNPPGTYFTPHTGFEVQESHQAPLCSLSTQIHKYNSIRTPLLPGLLCCSSVEYSMDIRPPYAARDQVHRRPPYIIVLMNLSTSKFERSLELKPRSSRIWAPQFISFIVTHEVDTVVTSSRHHRN